MLDSVRRETEPLPHEAVWLEGGQRYVVCAFYTDNYLPRALALMESLKAHRLNYYLKRYEHQGSWEATTRMKPLFLEHCLERFANFDIVYVDADAIIRQPLTFIDQITSDVGLWLHPRQKQGRWYLRITASVVYVRNNDAGRHFTRCWSNPKLQTGRMTVDEDMLQAAFGEFEGLSITVLPASYVKIFDENKGQAVIEHFQASRGEFNLRRALRKSRQLGTIIGIVGAVALLVWYFLG
jgi:hypothetical protein